MLKIETVLERINRKCKERNYEFLGFCDKNGKDCEWCGSHITYLKLHCNICGNDWKTVTYDNFIRGNGCPKCWKKKISEVRKLDLKIVLNKIYKKCKERNYDFLGFCDKNGNGCEWYGNKTYLKLHCNICGNDWNSTRYYHFMNNIGCPKCRAEKVGKDNRLNLNITLEHIEKRCTEANYEFLGFCDKNGDDCDYRNAHTYLKLHCKICGNDWNTTNYNKFIHCKKGCPKCHSSKLEEEMRFFLKNEQFEEQKHFDWLGQQRLDFYLPLYNCAIECQGKQHFGLGGWKESFEVLKERDQRKKRLCDEHGIRILYYSNLGIDYPYEVFEDKEKLLEEIKKN